MNELYGSTQVKEIKLSKQDIINIVHENIKARLSTSYDFDYNNPIVIFSSTDELIFRFIQSTVTIDRESRLIQMKSLEEINKK